MRRIDAPAYYNEIDPHAAQWLRNLIAAGRIAPGEVDERSIADVRADDLRGFTQCHFFAGIGVWSHALRLAGWPDDKAVWTGSCPCQPFSVAGKGAGEADDRHLWPAWFNLIRECRPVALFGEQVDAAIRHGWLDAVQADMEGIGYAVGATVFPAAGVGAPHGRHRLYFVADANEAGRGLERRSELLDRERTAQRNDTDGCGEHGGMGDASGDGLAQRIGDGRIQPAAVGTQARETVVGRSDVSFWSDAEWIACADWKARPTQPGLFPLAHGATGRVGKLRAYGNAICAPAAQAFIEVYMECRP